MDLYDIKQELNKGKSIYDIPLRVTYYARVSTDTDEQINSLQNQIQYYSNFIRNVTNWTYIEGYIDEGISGTSVTKRESFLRMVKDAKLGKFDFIVTKEISRFSRSTLDSIKYTQDLLACGVGVLFQSDNINTLLPDSELRLTIMSSIAQDEVRKLSERVKFGMKRAIENGVVLGNNKIWGYNKENGKLVIDEEQAKIVRIIFELYAIDNYGIRAIARELTQRGYKNTQGNPFTFTTIKNILVNPKYKGYYCGKKTQKYDYRTEQRKMFSEEEWVMFKAEEDVPPIVSEELWDKANSVLAKRSKEMQGENKVSYNNKYKYSGKIQCGEDNSIYQRRLYRYPSGDKEYWKCRFSLEKGKDICSSPTVYTSELDEIVRSCYDRIVTNKSEIIHNLIKIYSALAEKSNIKNDIAKCKVKINEILKRKDKLLDLSVAEKISDDEFESRNRQFNEEISELKMEIENFEKQENIQAEFNIGIEKLRAVIAKELDFQDGFEDTIIDSLIEKIIVYKTDNKNVIDVKVHIKILDEVEEFKINRKKK